MGPGHEERRTRKCSCKRCGFPGLSLCVCRTVRTAIAKPLLNLPVKRPSTLTKTTFYSLLLPPVGTPYGALPLARSLSPATIFTVSTNRFSLQKPRGTISARRFQRSNAVRERAAYVLPANAPHTQPHITRPALYDSTSDSATERLASVDQCRTGEQANCAHTHTGG